MSPRNALRCVRLAMGIAVVIAVVSGLQLARLLWPLPAWRPPDQRVSASAISASDPGANLDLPALSVIWQRDLRQPLVDPPPAAPPVAQEAALNIHLLGTAVEPNRRYGLFQLSNNTIVVKPAGSAVEGLEIVAIDRGRVVLRGPSREYELTVPWYERIREAEARDGR